MNKFKRKEVTIEAIQWDESIKVHKELCDLANWENISDFNPQEHLIIHMNPGQKLEKGDWITKGLYDELSLLKADEFEKFFEPLSTENLTFGQATEAAKYHRQKVARYGWNGSGMYAYIVPAQSFPAQTVVAREEFGEMVPYREYWALKTAQGDVATWAPSGSDSLAEDWYIVE